MGVRSWISPIYRRPRRDSNPQPSDPKSYNWWSTVYLWCFDVHRIHFMALYISKMSPESTATQPICTTSASIVDERLAPIILIINEERQPADLSNGGKTTWSTDRTTVISYVFWVLSRLCSRWKSDLLSVKSTIYSGYFINCTQTAHGTVKGNPVGMGR